MECNEMLSLRARKTRSNLVSPIETQVDIQPREVAPLVDRQDDLNIADWTFFTEKDTASSSNTAVCVMKTKRSQTVAQSGQSEENSSHVSSDGGSDFS